MRRGFSFAFFLGYFFTAIAFAHAESQKVESNHVCKAYIDNPADFKRIPTHSCDCENSRGSCDCFSPGGAHKSTYALYLGLGTCGTMGVKVSTPGSQWDELDISNSQSNGFGFGGGIHPLEYKGKTYALVTVGTSEEIQYLARVDDDEITILCGFVYPLSGWEIAEGHDRPLCQKFQLEQYEMASERVDDLKEAEIQYGKPLPSETNVIKTADLDLTGNGKPVKVFTIALSSGAGCGCGSESLSIGASDAKGADSGSAVNAIDAAIVRLTTPEPCDGVTNWSAIKIDGKGYIAKNLLFQQSDVPIPSPSDKPYRDRILYKYDGKDFSPVCRLTPVARKAIDYQVMKADMLDYTPVEK